MMPPAATINSVRCACASPAVSRIMSKTVASSARGIGSGSPGVSQNFGETPSHDPLFAGIQKIGRERNLVGCGIYLDARLAFGEALGTILIGKRKYRLLPFHAQIRNRMSAGISGNIYFGADAHALQIPRDALHE